jgi:thymidine kinase
MRSKRKNGCLTVYAGPMYAGKTTALIAELETSIEDNKTVLVLKPKIDNRYATEDVVSHDGTSLRKETGHTVQCLELNESVPLKDLEDIDVLLIDEAQFFNELCYESIPVYLEHGIDVIAVGLDMDSEGKGFGSMPFLLEQANIVYKLSSICSICGDEATRTFRKFTASSSSQVLIGGNETYEPRCLEHWLEGQREKARFLH